MASVEEEMGEVHDLLEKMDFNAAGVGSREVRVEKLRKDVNALQGQYRKAVTKGEEIANRQSLLGGIEMRNLDLDMNSGDHRERYVHSTRELEAQSDIIDESRRTIEETIGVASESMAELDRQKGVMKHSKARLEDTNDSLTRGNRLMRKISQRICANKLIMAAMVLVLLVGIGLIVYFAWIRDIVAMYAEDSEAPPPETAPASSAAAPSRAAP